MADPFCDLGGLPSFCPLFPSTSHSLIFTFCCGHALKVWKPFFPKHFMHCQLFPKSALLTDWQVLYFELPFHRNLSVLVLLLAGSLTSTARGRHGASGPRFFPSSPSCWLPAPVLLQSWGALLLLGDRL